MIFYLPIVIFLIINIWELVIYAQTHTMLGSFFIFATLAEWIVFGVLIMLVIFVFIKRWSNYKSHILINLGLFGLIYILFNLPFSVIPKIYERYARIKIEKELMQGRKVPITKSEQCAIDLANKISKPEAKYAPGEISITFDQKIDGSEASEFLSQSKVKLKSVVFPKETYFFEITSGSADAMLNVLKNSNLFTEEDKKLDSITGQATKELFAYAKLTTTRSMVDALLSNQPSLIIKSVEIHAISILGTVPEGQEIETICLLKDNEKVSDADLNYLTESPQANWPKIFMELFLAKIYMALYIWGLAGPLVLLGIALRFPLIFFASSVLALVLAYFLSRFLSGWKRVLFIIVVTYLLILVGWFIADQIDNWVGLHNI